MTRRFQFSLNRLLLATIWLSIGSAALGEAWRTDLDFSWALMVLLGVFLAGLGGAIGAMTGTAPVRQSVYGAIGALCIQVALVAFAFLMNT